MAAAGAKLSLRRARRRRGLSQRDLAEAVGVAQSTIQRIEAGEQVPHPRTAGAIAAVLDVPIESVVELMGDGDADGTSAAPPRG